MNDLQSLSEIPMLVILATDLQLVDMQPTFFSILILVSILVKLLLEKLMGVLLGMDHGHDTSIMCQEMQLVLSSMD